MRKTAAIRPVQPGDVAELWEMVRDLAEYEQAADQLIATPAMYEEVLFTEHPSVFAVVAPIAEAVSTGSHRLAGFALYFRNFSTWLGRKGIYLEDLYVRPEYRGLGIGKGLLGQLAQECVSHGYGRLEWWVLDSNEPALGFYRRLNAQPMDEWTVHRITGSALTDLARLTDKNT